MGKKKTVLKELSCGRIFEAKTDSSGAKKFPVIIISEGLGNVVDRNYYTAEAIKSGVEVYEGKPAYLNHPTESQEQEQPGRSVTEMCGHYEDCQAVKDDEGRMALKAMFVPIASKTEAIGLIDHSIQYKKKYPDKDYMGISINGNGEGSEMEYETFIKTFKPSDSDMEKFKQIEGKPVNVVTKFTDALSADIVTAAGARGRILKESNFKKRRLAMIKWMQKLLSAAEKGDKKGIQEAAKKIVENADESDEKKHEAEAGSLAKHVCAMKKAEAKKEDESEEEYEKRMLQGAMKKAGQEAADDKKKADEAKDDASKKDDADADKEDDESESDDADKKKKDDADKEGDDAAAKDKKKDDAADDSGDDEKDGMKKLQKQMAAMQSEIEALKKGKEADAEKSKSKDKESAKTKIELETKNRAQEVDKELAKSGLPRYASDELRKIFVEYNTPKDERAKLIESAKEVVEKARTKEIERLFATEDSGFTEISPTGDGKTSNDELFTKKEE